ncbi:MAG: c-type cytochrome [Ignavibacteria bacterium]|nr:c-type cytochrome [Ignavibacteria bacterium]
MKILKSIILFFPLFLLVYVFSLKFGYLKGTEKNQPYEAISDMDRQAKVHPQKLSTSFDDGLSTRQPVDSTVPRYGSKYQFEQVDFLVPETQFINPLPNEDFYLKRGKQRFETFCVPCHNHDGKGRGLIITKANLMPDEEGFPEPANLLRTETIRMSDGRLFHVLSSGQNLMFPVSEKLSENERWAIIKYIRFLQKLQL